MIATLRRYKPNPAVSLPNTPRVNRASPQSRGLVAWWPLSWCTGNAAPDVFGAGHGTAAEMEWRVDATFGATPQFDGSREIIFSDTHLPAGASPRSLCAWVSFSELPVYPSTWGALFYGSNSYDHGLMIGAGNQDRWKVPGCLGMSQWGQELITPQPYNDGAWHHLTATFDGAVWSVYVDGTLENAKALPTDTQPGTGRIGSLNWGPEFYWKGFIRDVRVYGRQLSAAEVRSLYDPATRFDLWLPQKQWLARSTAGPPYLVGAGQVYVTGQNGGQVQSAGAAAGEVTMPGAFAGEVR